MQMIKSNLNFKATLAREIFLDFMADENVSLKSQSLFFLMFFLNCTPCRSPPHHHPT